MTNYSENPKRPSRTSDDVAGVLSALGRLMRSLRDQDLALQNAVSEMADRGSATSNHLVHIQHIDLITQTHHDLARFLPELAACLETTVFDPHRLTTKLTLQSLRDHLLENDGVRESEATISGDLSLF